MILKKTSDCAIDLKAYGGNCVIDIDKNSIDSMMLITMEGF